MLFAHGWVWQCASRKLYAILRNVNVVFCFSSGVTMYVFRILLMLIVGSSLVFAQDTWIQQHGGTGIDYGRVVAYDNSGNMYLSGSFSDRALIADTQITGWQYGSSFVTKLTSSGKLTWVVAADNERVFIIQGMCCDSVGNTYVSGAISDTARFGNTVLYGKWDWDYFIAKLDSAGNVLWARSFGGEWNEQANFLAFDSKRNVLYVSGLFERDCIFEKDTISSYGGLDVFIAAYNPITGSEQWVRRIGGKKTDATGGIAIMNNGDLMLGLTLQDSARVGGITLSQFERYAAVACCSPQGDIRWAKKLCDNYSVVNGIVADKSGRFLLAGTFHANTDSAWFDTVRVQNRGFADVFTMRINDTGRVLWAKSAGGKTTDDVCNGLTVGKDNSAWVCGRVRPPVFFGNLPCYNPNGWTAYLARYDSNGVEKELLYDDGVGGNEVLSVAADDKGNVIATGTLYAVSNIGGTTFTTRGESDIFLWKPRSAPPPTLVNDNNTQNTDISVGYASFTLHITAPHGINRVRVYDIIGKEYYSELLTTYTNTIDIPIWCPAEYMVVVVESGNKYYTTMVYR